MAPISLLSACSSFKANADNYSITPDNINSRFMRVNILSSFLVKSKTHDSLPITELSDLAWDEDEQLLYVVSDQGLLYHLKLDFTDRTLKTVDIIFATRLKKKRDIPFKGKFTDAEGLTLQNGANGKKGDSQLIISFENKPRIDKYSTSGHFISKVKIVKKLRKRKYFRGKNKALESVTLHPKFGVLTAAEQPLKENPLNQQTLYSSTGKEWHFAASKIKNSSITALEVLPNGDVLILERAYNGLLSPIVISLRQLHITKCNNLKLCDTSLIAKFDTSDGWILDNFEGLTHIRDNQYLMVSDNNNNPFQKTILVLFEILDKKAVTIN
ncbi:MAG: esterase-like activity of phytase family protein [Cocleimonas sp.]